MISIIIPVYNGAEWLAEAIESALSQRGDELPEVIVINDGSTDNSLAIAKEYPIKLVDQVNKGLASARNTGIMVAKGNWILPLDADDKLLPNAISKIESKIPTVRQILVGDTTPDIIAPSFKEFGLGNREVILGNPILEDFKTANRIGYCSAIRKSALLEVGGYNPKMVWGAEDYDLWFDLLKRGKKLATIPEVLWMYRVKEKSMWTETAKHQTEFMNQIKINHPTVWNQ